MNLYNNYRFIEHVCGVLNTGRIDDKQWSKVDVKTICIQYGDRGSEINDNRYVRQTIYNHYIIIIYYYYYYC